MYRYCPSLTNDEDAAYDPQRFGPLPSLEEGEQPLSLGARGLRVRLWVEKGILLALIGE